MDGLGGMKEFNEGSIVRRCQYLEMILVTWQCCFVYLVMICRVLEFRLVDFFPIALQTTDPVLIFEWPF